MGDGTKEGARKPVDIRIVTPGASRVVLVATLLALADGLSLDSSRGGHGDREEAFGGVAGVPVAILTARVRKSQPI